jgi:glycosyltransferase involved in cell wall biosynthesis
MEQANNHQAKAPAISVVIPIYNMELYIDEAIQSVLKQTFSDYELVLVDNASTDNTQQIISSYANNSNIRIFINELNLGMAQNWNKCLYHAKGKYIKFLNADDLLEETALENFAAILEAHPEISLATSHYELFGIDNQIQHAKKIGRLGGRKAIIDTIQTNNWIGCPTQVIFRRNDLYLGFFNISSTWWSDMDLWYRLLTVGDLYVIDKVLSKNRSHANQISNQFGNQKSLISQYSFMKVLNQSDQFEFCKTELEHQIKKLGFIMYYEGVINLLRGNSTSGWHLLKKSDHALISFQLFKIPFYFFNKKRKK